MKVIFVGIHNKPGKTPLCSSTKSGKLIDRIIEGIKPVECLKTNLYDIDYFPVNHDEQIDLALEWHDRIYSDYDCVIILLGAHVRERFCRISGIGHIVEIAHPASERSHAEMDKYVSDAIEEIKKHLK
jgi:hypothetical protein